MQSRARRSVSPWILLAAAACLLAGSVSRAQEPEPPAPRPAAAVLAPLRDALASLQQRQFPEALAAADRALAAATGASDVTGQAIAHGVRAEALFQLGKKEDAFAALQTGIEMSARAGDAVQRIVLLGTRAALLPSSSEAALRAAREAASAGETEPTRPRQAANALHNNGLRLLGAGRLREAEVFFEAALRLWQKHEPGTRFEAGELANLGIIHSQVGAFEKGRDVLERAVTIQERVGPDSLQMAGILTNLGALYERHGDLQRGEQYTRRALELKEKLAPGSVDLARTLANMGSLSLTRGNLAAAQDYLLRALEIFQKENPDSPLVAAVLNNLGGVSLRWNDFTAARDFGARAVQILDRLVPGSLDAAGGHHNLGTVQRILGDHPAALASYRLALAVVENQAPESLLAATLLSSIGHLELEERRVDSALDHQRRALAVLDRAAPESLPYATTLRSYGVALIRAARNGEGQEQLERAMTLFDRLAPRSLDTAVCLTELAQLRRNLGDLKNAAVAARRAWAIVEEQANAVAEDQARLTLLRESGTIARVLAGVQVAQGNRGGALLTLEQARSLGLEQALWERRTTPPDVDPALWQEYRRASAARRRAEAAVAERGSRRAIAESALARGREVAATQKAGLRAAVDDAVAKHQAAQAELTLAAQQTQQLARRLRSGSRSFAPRFTPGMVQGLAGKLSPGTAVVYFSFGQPECRLFLLRAPARGTPFRQRASADLTVVTLRPTAPELKQQVRAFRDALAHERSDAVRLGRALFASLFPGAAGKAVLAADRVIVAPDGPLWELPFAALVPPSGNAVRYLGVEKPLALTPSLGILDQSLGSVETLKGRKPVALAVGDPIFMRAAGAQVAADPGRIFPRPRGERVFLFTNGRPPESLPGTRADAAEVARLYGVQPLLGEAATEAAVRERAGSADVIHLATHGYLHPYSAMASGVLLTEPLQAVPGDTTNDGALQAGEIYEQLKLKAEVVVLAACETARGEDVGSDPLAGLTRALLIAGARSVVTSQWQVRDDSTRALMAAFHRRLRAGLDKDDALRGAMAEVAGQVKWRHPFYWSGFVLLGRTANGGLGTPK